MLFHHFTSKNKANHSLKPHVPQPKTTTNRHHVAELFLSS